jgi:hypothetical protein
VGVVLYGRRGNQMAFPRLVKMRGMKIGTMGRTITAILWARQNGVTVL